MCMTTTPTIQPSIPAAKNMIGDEAIYYLLGRPALKKTFHRIWFQSVGRLPSSSDGPVIFYLNHSSWWDGYIMMIIHRRIFHRRFYSYLMMEEKQLRDFRFFTWCGAFSINRHDPDDSIRSVEYISSLLRQPPARGLYIFPQGRIVHNDHRPLTLYPGIARIALRVGNVTLCPISCRFEFGGRYLPEAFIRVGPIHRPEPGADIDTLIADITRRLTASMDTIRDAIVSGATHNFSVLMHGRSSIDQRFAQAVHWLRRHSRSMM